MRNNVLTEAGISRLEHPITRCVRIACSQLIALSDQPRLERSLERHQLSWWCLDSVFLLRHHQLPCSPTTPRSTTTTPPLDPGQSRPLHQHCSASVPSSNHLLRILAAGTTSYSVKHELVQHYVLRDSHVRHSLLLFQG